MPWYDGQTLMQVLETMPLDDLDTTRPFRMPVQWVNRPNHVGDAITVEPSGKQSTIKSIHGPTGECDSARAGQSVTLCFDDEIDASRGDIIASQAGAPKSADQFRATIVWMHEEPMLPGRPTS